MSKGAELRINADYARLIQPFISKEETRYYLGGFYVEKHPKVGALIVATDGHSLGIFHDESAVCSIPGIIRLSKTTIAACKGEEGKSRTLVVSGDAATVYEAFGEATGDGMTVAAQDDVVIDGTFPQWRNVVPPMPNGSGPATFNFAMLKKFEKLRAECSKITELRIVSRSPTEPALIFVGRPDFLGVLMPFRGSGPEAIPNWLPAMAA